MSRRRKIRARSSGVTEPALAVGVGVGSVAGGPLSGSGLDSVGVGGGFGVDSVTDSAGSGVGGHEGVAGVGGASKRESVSGSSGWFVASVQCFFTVVLLKTGKECSRRSPRRLLRQLLKLVEDGASERLEPAAFARAHLGLVDREGRQVRQGGLRAPQALFELGRGAAALARAREEAARVVEELASFLGDPSSAQGAHQHDRLTRLQPVAFGAGHGRHLVVAGQPGEGVGQGRADKARVHLALDRRRQPTVEREATLDPIGLAAEQLGDRLRAETVAPQRRHDAGLVEDRERSPGSVAHQQQPLRLLHALSFFDDDGDVSSALAPPALEPLESVDDLVAVAVFDDAQGLIGQRDAPVDQPHTASAQGGEARSDPRQRNEEHSARGGGRTHRLPGALCWSGGHSWAFAVGLVGALSVCVEATTQPLRQVAQQGVLRSRRPTRGQREHLPEAVHGSGPEGLVAHEVEVLQPGQGSVDLLVVEAQLLADTCAAVEAHAVTVRRQAKEGVDRRRFDWQLA